MIAGVGGIISSAKKLTKSSTRWLVDALVQKNAESGYTRASREIVGRIVQEGETDMLITATMTAFTVTLGARTIEGCVGIEEACVGGSIHNQLMNTIGGK